MNKQVFAALSLVCGLLGFNLIAIVQTFGYLQLSRHLEAGNTITTVYAIGGFYKISALVLGILAIVLCYLYYRSQETDARLISYLGGIFGVLSAFLAIFPLYLWMLK